MSPIPLVQTEFQPPMLQDSRGASSALDVPEDFRWLRYFSAEHLAAFFTELLVALINAQRTGNWMAVEEIISDWKTTASIEADPVLAQAIDQGLHDVAAGRGVSWEDLRKELDL